MTGVQTCALPIWHNKYHAKKKNAMDTKNSITIATTCHMTSCEWWRSNSGSTPPPLITQHIMSCGKSCKIFYVPSITMLSVTLDTKVTKHICVCACAAFFVWVSCTIHKTCKYEF